MQRNLLIHSVVLLCLVLGLTSMATAQDPAKTWRLDGPYRILDTPEVKAKMETARRLAGDDKYLRITQRLVCTDTDENGVLGGPPGANTFPANPRNPLGWKERSAVPTKVFDNVYYVGGMEVGGWVIDTGDGYIMLDSSYDYGATEILEPNMKKLGLDPAKVKYILITHAGPDHIGAAKYFQDNYGTKVVSDVTLKPRSYLPDPPVVTVMKDGDTLTLGDTTITMLVTPRRVGRGGFSYLIPVKINGAPHMWATYGNTGVMGKIEDKLVYRKAVARFLTYVDALKVDIAISSHPFVDGSLKRMEQIRNSKPGTPNPFLIGQQAARRYFEILDACAAVKLAREQAGIDGSGTMRLADMPQRKGP